MNIQPLKLPTTPADARKAGATAAYGGHSRDENPYADGVLRTYWDSGWREAHTPAGGETLAKVLPGGDGPLLGRGRSCGACETCGCGSAS